MEESDVLSDLLSGKEAKINIIGIEAIQCVNDIRGEVGLGLRSNIQLLAWHLFSLDLSVLHNKSFFHW